MSLIPFAFTQERVDGDPGSTATLAEVHGKGWLFLMNKSVITVSADLVGAKFDLGYKGVTNPNEPPDDRGWFDNFVIASTDPIVPDRLAEPDGTKRLESLSYFKIVATIVDQPLPVGATIRGYLMAHTI